MQIFTSFHLDPRPLIFVLQLAWPSALPYSSDDCSFLDGTLSRSIQQLEGAENTSLLYISEFIWNIQDIRANRGIFKSSQSVNITNLRMVQTTSSKNYQLPSQAHLICFTMCKILGRYCTSTSKQGLLLAAWGLDYIVTSDDTQTLSSYYLWHVWHRTCSWDGNTKGIVQLSLHQDNTDNPT